MIFIAGPRQAGKTTFSKQIAKSFTNSLYFNWDIPTDRSLLFEDPGFFSKITRKDATTPLIILDEIHKYKNWKNYLKGTYDKYEDDYKFLVTGSGRLDVYQKGGDLLAGRYYMLYFFPFTVSELGNRNISMSDFLSDPLQLALAGDDLEIIWAILPQIAMLLVVKQRVDRNHCGWYY